MNKKIQESMQRWADWRDEQRKEILAQLGYGETMIGKCLDDMPTTVCNLCRGKDDDCQRCNGTGKIIMSPTGTICPAFIPSTHRASDDETSQKIDRIMCELRRNGKTLGYYLVLLQEYTRIGRREDKAGRMHLTTSAYKMRLSRAHEKIRDGLRMIAKSPVFQAISPADER